MRFDSACWLDVLEADTAQSDEQNGLLAFFASSPKRASYCPSLCVPVQFANGEMRYNVKSMEERGIMRWLHRKGGVITVFISIELRLPFKESFGAFFFAFTHKLALSLAKCTRRNHLHNANDFHKGICAPLFYLLMGFNIMCSRATTLFCAATSKAGSGDGTVSADPDK